LKSLVEVNYDSSSSSLLPGSPQSQVTINGQIVKVNVVGDPSGTVNHPISLLINLTNEAGIPYSGIDAFSIRVTIDSPNAINSTKSSINNSAPVSQLEMISDGCYKLTWTPLEAGDYFVSVLVETKIGKHLKNTLQELVRDIHYTVIVPGSQAYVICAASMWSGLLQHGGITSEAAEATSKEEYLASKVVLIERAQDLVAKLLKAAELEAKSLQ